MKLIKAEGMEFIYVMLDNGYPRDRVLNLNIVGVRPTLDDWETVITPNTDDIRLTIVEPSYATGEGLITFLHWIGEMNLVELDQRIANGNYSDTDFERSVLTQYGYTSCLHCNDWSGATLYVSDEGYSVPSDLMQHKIGLRKSINGFKTCPKCGKEFNRLVVKIFSDA